MLTKDSKTLCFRVDQLIQMSRGVACLLLVGYFPAIGQAQEGAVSELNPREKTEESVLVRDDSDSSDSTTLTANANGVAKVNDDVPRYSGKSTFTAQPFPSAPQIPSTFRPEPPSEMLVPQDPTEDTFTKPFVNELRGENLGAPSAEKPSDGTEARGTFATTKQDWQEQSINPSGLRPQNNLLPGNANGSASPVYPAGQFGSRAQPSPTRLNSGPPLSSEQSVLQSRPNDPSDQPSQWMEESTGQTSFNRSGNSGSLNQPAINNGNPSRNPNYSPSYGTAYEEPVNSPPVRSSAMVQNAYDTQSMGQRGSQQNVVQPTGFNEFVGASKAGTDLAKSIMARYAVDNFTGPLPGEPVKLVDMLRQPLAIDQRKSMIIQYWTTYYDWAMLIGEQENAQWLSRIPTPGNVAEQAMLDIAQASANNRVLAARIQLGKSQSKLVQYLPNWNVERLPIPNDLPLIQKYKTNYEIYKSYQLMPANLRGIDQMLPDTLELIANRAAAVQLANNAAEDVLGALASRQATTSHAVDIARQCRFLNQDLIASVISYNQAIADYSLTVARGYQTPEQIEAMLIAKPKIDTNDVAQRFNDAREQQRLLDANGRNTSSSPQVQNFVAPNNSGQPALIGSQPGQPFSNSGQGNGRSRNFDLNDQRGFQGTGQGNNQNPQSVIGGSVAPATPVGQNSFGGSQNPTGGAFGPQLPNQQSQNQPQSILDNGIRAAQSPFGSGTGQGR